MPITTMQGEMNASVWRKDGDEGSSVWDIWGIQGGGKEKQCCQPKSKLQLRKVSPDEKIPKELHASTKLKFELKKSEAAEERRVSVKAEASEPVCNLHCTSTKHLLGLECHRKAERR